MADYDWHGELAKISLGKPYKFTRAQYEYCEERGAPIAVLYYDTKTSGRSQQLYSAVFKSKDAVKALFQTMSSYGKADKAADQYLGGYCCVFVLDRLGDIACSDPDTSFFSQKARAAGAESCKFPALFLSYGGKTKCHELSDAAGQSELAQAIYSKCESGSGVGKFSQWSGRTGWIGAQPKKPALETKPAKSGRDNLNSDIAAPSYWVDVCAKKQYADYDPNYDGSFSGVTRANSRQNVSYMLNLADVSTPETTYGLIGAYDMHHTESYPVGINNTITPYFRKVCGRVETIWKNKCLNGGYKNLFYEGKKYRYFMFFEFSHGKNYTITIGITYDEIWNTFKSMRSHQRIWGLFDSCESGSMIEHEGLSYKPLQAAAPADKMLRQSGEEQTQPGQELGAGGVIQYIEDKFKRRAALLEAVTGGQTTAAAAAATYDPRMILWSSCPKNNSGWYQPGASTDFSNAFHKAMTSDYWNNFKYEGNTRYGWANAGGTNGQQAFRKVQINGTSFDPTPEGEPNSCIPQCRNYPSNDSFETNIILY